MTLSNKILVEIASHEGIVLEAYKDVVGVWTWGIGMTNNSGHEVYPRYKDNPQSVARVIELFEWDLTTKYLPDVLHAFDGHDLTENQLAAALSFHYNTGAIRHASWVKSFMAGKIKTARKEIMNWHKPASITVRRQHERDLFFDGTWGDGHVLVIPVSKPTYHPYMHHAKHIDLIAELEKEHAGS